MSASDLDLLLHDLAGHAAWPPTPRFRAVPAGRSTRRGLGLAALLAAAAIAVFGAVAVASDQLLHAVTIQRVPRLETPSPRSAADPLLGLLEPSVAAAATDAGFPVAIPGALGAPDAVTLRRQPATIVSLVYRPRPGLPASPGDPQVGALVSEFRGSGTLPFVGKIVGPGTTLDRVDVGGAPGVWIAGAPHEVFLPGGVDQLRLATNTLIWERGGSTYRLEADISREEALRIAGTVR